MMPTRILFIGRRSKTAERLQALPLFARGPKFNGADTADYQLELHSVSNQKAALARVRSEPPHIILIEVDGKPNSRGRFCEMLRYRLPTATIVAVGKQAPRGAFEFDAFLSVPLVEEEVRRVIFQIVSQTEEYQLKRGNVVLNIASRTVTTATGHYSMTPKQCSLLQMLMQRNGQVVSRKEIMQVIWETSFMDDTRTLDVHVRWLRERIEEDPSKPQYLLTARGVGYQLILPDTFSDGASPTDAASPTTQRRRRTQRRLILLRLD